MYILVKDTIPLGYQFVAVSHASLMCHLSYQNDFEYQQWLEKSFRKVVCVVTEEEFEKAKTYGDHLVITESTLGHTEIGLVFKPVTSIPKFFNYLRLLK